MKIIFSSYFLLIFSSYYSQKQDFDVYRNFYGAKSITHHIYDFSRDSTLKLTKYASVYEFDKLGNLVLKKVFIPLQEILVKIKKLVISNMRQKI